MRRGEEEVARRQEEVARRTLRSHSADMGDVVGLVKDVAKFLDRLQFEDLTEDCVRVRESLAARIDFTLRSFPSNSSSRHNSLLSLDLPLPPPPLPLSLPPSAHTSLDTTSSSHMSISMDSRPEQEEEEESYENHSTQPFPSLPAMPARTPAVAVEVAVRREKVEECEEDETYDSMVDEEEQPSMAFQPLETSTPHTSPRKAAPPSTTTMEPTMDTSNLPEEEEEDALYDTMMTGDEGGAPVEGKGGLTALGGLINSAKVLTAHSDHSGWLWRKESLFKANNRFWALLFSGQLFLYMEPKDAQEREAVVLKGATLRRHKKGRGFVLVMPVAEGKAKPAKHEFQTVNEEQAEEWIQALTNSLHQASLTPSSPPASAPASPLKEAPATPGKKSPKEKPKSPTKQAVIKLFNQISFSSSDEEAPSESKARSRRSATWSVASETADLVEDDEYETVEISRAPPAVATLRTEEPSEYDVPKPQASPTIPADLEQRMSAAASKMRRDSAASRAAKPAARPVFDDMEAKKARVRARQLAPLAASRPATVSSGQRPGEAMTMGRRPKARPAAGGRQRTHSEVSEAEMAPILDKISREGGYKPSVPARPRNLPLDCPPYSKVERKARPGPGTLPKPPLAARPLGNSFLHSLVATGRLGGELCPAGGPGTLDKSW